MRKKHQIIQFILGMALALLTNARTFAQRPDFLFEQQYPYECEYAGTHSLEITNGQGETECFFVAACDIAWIGYSIGSKETLRSDNLPAKVFKLSPDGELIGELTLGEEGRCNSIIRLYHDPVNSKFCFAMGKISDIELNYEKPFLAKFDIDLNLLWLREIELPEEYHKLFYGARSMMDSSGDIVFCTWSFHSSTLSNVFYIRLSTEGELLALGEFPQMCIYYNLSQGGLFEYQDGSGDYGQTFVGVDNMNPKPMLVRMDKDFTDFHTQDLPWSVHLSETETIVFGEYYSESYATNMSDSSLFITCRAERIDGYNITLRDNTIVLMKLDQNDSIIDIKFEPHDNDSVRTLAMVQGMDRSDDGLFYFCNGVYDRSFWYYGEIDGLNRLEVTKTDADANIIWSRCYGDGEHVFHPCSVMATSDDGCLVTGRYWTLDHSVAKVFAIKFFADGTLSVPEMETFVRPYMFYPNPVQDELHLQYSPDVKPTQIELYDLQGRLVHTQKNGLESINMKGLSSGTYTMRVTMEGGRVFTDKVVKE